MMGGSAKHYAVPYITTMTSPEKINSSMRAIPQIEKLMSDPSISCWESVLGRGAVLDTVKKQTSLMRDEIISGSEPSPSALTEKINDALSLLSLTKIQRVINCTGIIIHTNLGRSPLGEKIFSSMARQLSGYVNLEFHLPSESRGKRGGYAEQLVCALTGAEDAIIVNNNASSVFLILSALAKGREVIVSRGELIQIGGGFRIPDIMQQTGAKLVETGTTNITDMDDFRGAVTPDTAMIFSAHRSNFRIDGFTESPSIRDLASLKNENILLVRDLGSGNLARGANLPIEEPTAAKELSDGADIVCFSGDKLLGACQAGIICGRADLIKQLRSHPLMRMLRVDKITYFILQETLIHYANGSPESVHMRSMSSRSLKKLNSLADRTIRRVRSVAARACLKKVKLKAAFGGGSLPGEEIDSAGIRIDHPKLSPGELFTAFIRSGLPVIGTVSDGAFVLNFMTVDEKEIPIIADAIERITGK
jgi:L-seryl-tRNA(Ser) seleniumtransferase